MLGLSEEQGAEIVRLDSVLDEVRRERFHVTTRRAGRISGGGGRVTGKPYQLSYMPRERQRPWTLGAWVFVILCALQLCTLGYILVASAGVTLFSQ